MFLERWWKFCLDVELPDGCERSAACFRQVPADAARADCVFQVGHSDRDGAITPLFSVADTALQEEILALLVVVIAVQLIAFVRVLTACFDIRRCKRCHRERDKKQPH